MAEAEVLPPLRAPLEIGFDYTRSLGPVLSRFMTGLANRRILGARASDGTVHAPPFEYDPATFDPPTDLVEVGPSGTVLTWSWIAEPLDGQPLPHAFAWALIRLDGADTALLHAVDADHDAMATGMRVRPRWADVRVGSIRDIAYFEPAGPDGQSADGEGAEETGDPVSILLAPIQLKYQHTASPGESIFLRAIAEGRLLGQRCPACGKVYVPARGTCPVDGLALTDIVELPDTGIVTTFCIVNVPYPGQRVTPPYVAASVLLDGADIAFGHLILGCEASEVRMGMRIKGVWKPRDQWGTTVENIDHFAPTGEPDAPYDSFASHL
ncbi:MAG TPA: OB-fold domain-containing protein [Streptosporangiaceae bacterium]|nr:OB-fold domain-containing protein [Streptosporangiaceae bacterium]